MFFPNYSLEYRRSENVLAAASVPGQLQCTVRGRDGLILVWETLPSSAVVTILTEYDPGSGPFDEAVDGLNKAMLAALVMRT